MHRDNNTPQKTFNQYSLESLLDPEIVRIQNEERRPGWSKWALFGTHCNGVLRGLETAFPYTMRTHLITVMRHADPYVYRSRNTLGPL